MIPGPRNPSAIASPWPRRLAFATLIAAIPLVFFGGSVTTLHAGLAIDGWLVLEPGRGDHFLWLYPVDKWFRDVGTFVEHTHRLFGSLVGLLAIATVVATWVSDRRRISRALSVVALLAVVVQGAIGGLRVLERSEDLAFLHGAIAQAVFAALGASAVASSAGFAEPLGSRGSFRPGRLGVLTTLAATSTYVQIVAGAWLRHGGGSLALAVHGVLAVLVVGCAWLLAAEIAERAKDVPEIARPRVLALRKWILALLGTQVALGVAALLVLSVRPAAGAGSTLSLGSAVFPTLHVLVGGSLLLACVASGMWVRRLDSRPAQGAKASSEPRSTLEASAPIEVAR